MKKSFAQYADPITPVRPVKVDNGNSHAFVFGNGPLTADRVHFIASDNGISNDLEGPDYNTFSVMDQYVAAQKVADKAGLPCVVVAILDEARASYDAKRIVRELSARQPANQGNILKRGVQALRRTFG
jgi:hypothetical protein